MDTKELEIFSQLCEIIEESEEMSLEIIGHLDTVLLKLDNLEDSRDIKNEIDGIVNTIMTITTSMQAQDFHRQKIERVANLVNPDNDKFARAKHIAGDKYDDLVSDDDLEALIASHGV